MLTLTATENKINNIDFFARSAEAFQFLQIANFKDNKIKQLSSIYAPFIKHLNLNTNEIFSCSAFRGHLQLQILELRKNQLKDCDGIENLPNLTQLYLAENQIKSIKGLKNLPELS